jgi:hypothetical protein
MATSRRSITVPRVLLLMCGLLALALTSLASYLVLRFLIYAPNLSFLRLLREVWLLVSYWPRFFGHVVAPTVRVFWLLPFSRSPLLPEADPRPWHLVAQLGATGLAVIHALSLRRSAWLWAALALLFPFAAPIVLGLLKPKPLNSPKGETHVCAHCGQEHTRGKRYTFHYGRRVSGKGDYNIPFFGFRATYQILGNDGVWLCRACVLGRLAGTYLFVVVFAALLHFEEGWASGALGLVLSLLMATFFAYIFREFLGLGGLSVLGERLAIRVRRPRLQRMGADSFFDHQQHERLQRSA